MSEPTSIDILVIGAGPVGLFTVFEAGLLGLKCHLIDNLDRPGGQCTELYPQKPIYDIPGVALQTAQEHVDALMEQIKPFSPSFSFNQRVDEITAMSVEEGAPAKWKVRTNTGEQFITHNVFIAAGAGSFEPRKPSIPTDPDSFVGRGLEYAVRDVSRYHNQHVVIFGGGDSALDWAVELAPKAASLSLVHRRDAFRGAQATEAEMRGLVEQGKIKLLIPFVIEDLQGDERGLKNVVIQDFKTRESQVIRADQTIFLFGLSKKLGPILDWELELDGKQKKIQVNTKDFMSNREGIFAVGDINDYPGKLDLILCGFHETTLAVQEAYRRLNPGGRVPFSYTTSNAKLQSRLGVDPS